MNSKLTEHYKITTSLIFSINVYTIALVELKDLEAFKEFDNMFDVKSFNRGKQQANFDEIKFLSDLGHLPSRCFEECPYCARLIKIMESNRNDK